MTTFAPHIPRRLRLAAALVPLLLGGATAAPAATLEVDQTDPSCSDSIGTPFCTIQAAIDNAVAGDEVQVGAGRYDEGLVLDRDLALRGAGISAVAGACDGLTQLAWGGTPLTVRSGVRAAVRDVTIVGGAAVQGGGIFNAGNTLLADSEVCGGSATDEGAGIYTDGVLVLRRVQVYDNHHLSIGAAGGGLFVQNHGGAFVDLSSFTGNWATQGAGIAVAAGGWLVLTRSSVESNLADAGAAPVSGAGGGIHNAGWAWVHQTQVGQPYSGNVVDHDSGLGGGIYNSGDLLLTSSTLAGNAIDRTSLGNGAPAFGAGLYNSGTAAVVSSTISGNVIHALVFGNGAGIANFGTLAISSATITANVGALPGAGLYHGDGVVQMRNTVIAHQAAGTDCDGAILTDGYNIDSDDTCGLVSASSGGTDQPGVADAGLLPLGAYGGPTQTHALAEDSPAVDAGNPQGCMADVTASGVAGVALVADQRGDLFVDVPGALPDPSGCDAGAFELNLVANGTMEDDEDRDRVPDDWTGTGLGPDDRRYCNPLRAHTGYCHVRVSGGGAAAKRLVQEIDRAGSAGDEYTLRLFARAEGVTGAPRVLIQFEDPRSTGSLEEFELPLDTGSYHYQEWSLAVITTGSSYDVVRIVVEAGDGGELSIDDVSLVPTL